MDSNNLDKKSPEINKLVDRFVIYWRKYQESWTEEEWNYYNKFAFLSKNQDKNSNLNNNNNELYLNCYTDMNVISNLLKADIRELNNSSSSIVNEKVSETNKIKIQENLLCVKSLSKYENLVFSNDQFYSHQEKKETKKEAQTNQKIKNFEIIDFEKTELEKINEISTDSNESQNELIRNENKKNNKTKKNKRNIMKEIDMEIDMQYHSENNCNSHIIFKKNLTREDPNVLYQNKKKSRSCLDCTIL